MKIEQTRRVFRLVTAGAGLTLVGLISYLWLAGSLRGIKVVPVSVSYAAPSLRLNDLQGNPTALDDYRGQVVLVNLWATWCAPCKREMPALQKFHAQHAQEGFTVIAIDQGESVEDISRFVSEYGLTFPIWLDPETAATRQAFHTANLPSSFVIDRIGAVRLQWVGGIDLPTLDEYITPLILE
jgi:cytochrome c biogenesis protein CcmG, thiol:disulfide interchange protein DsbE